MKENDILSGEQGALKRALYKSMGFSDSQLRKPVIAIANSYTNATPGHYILNQLCEQVKAGILAAGGTPMVFSTVAPCDGIAEGHEGMRYILPTRDLIASTVECMVRAHRFDGLVLLGSCDKIVPGMLMAAARLEMPAIFLNGGPMMPACYKGKHYDGNIITEAIGWKRQGKIDEAEFARIENLAEPCVGSCAMLGEDMEDESKGTFNGAPVWGRIATVAAGPVFNFILAFVFAVIIVTLVGYDPAKVTQVESGSTVAEAGLQEGDIIKEYQGYHIDLARDLYLYMYLNNPQEDETIHMTVERDGKDVELAFKPDVQVRYLLGFNRKSTDSLEVASLIPGMGLSETGVEPGDVITSINGTRLESSDDYTAYLAEHPLTSEPVTITYERDGLEYNAEVTPSESRTAVLDFSYNLAYTKTQGFEVLKYGTLEVKYMIRSTLLSLKELLTGGLGVKDLSGPVGVVDAIGSTYEASKSEGMLTIWVNMLYMAALLSANLGVMNLLPLPALDGGRLVFLIIEAIRRKPVNRQIEGMVHFAGLMVLMLLMVVVMYNDILKIF